MSTYKNLQIIKHALAYYIQREGASQQDIEQERRLLDTVTKAVVCRKKAFKITKGGSNEKDVKPPETCWDCAISGICK